jgi:lysine 2,3-aminomutase
VIDAPGGGGKITVVPPEFVLEINAREVILKNYEDQVYRYQQVEAVPDAVPADDPARLTPLQRLPS